MWTWRRPLQKLWSCSGLFTGFVTGDSALQMQFIPLTVEGTTCCFIRLTTVKQHNQQVATSWTLRRGYFLSPWHLWRVVACPHYVVAMLLRLLYRIRGAVMCSSALDCQRSHDWAARPAVEQKLRLSLHLPLKNLLKIWVQVQCNLRHSLLWCSELCNGLRAIVKAHFVWVLIYLFFTETT